MNCLFFIYICCVYYYIQCTSLYKKINLIKNINVHESLCNFMFSVMMCAAMQELGNKIVQYPDAILLLQQPITHMMQLHQLTNASGPIYYGWTNPSTALPIVMFLFDEGHNREITQPQFLFHTLVTFILQKVHTSTESTVFISV